MGVACSPSLGLLLHRAEHTAGPAGAQAHRDAHQDELVPEVARQGPHRGDVARLHPCVWGAWDGARQDAAADAAHPCRAVLADADAGKWAGLAPDVQEQDAFRTALQSKVREQQGAAEPCKPDAVPFEARSCGAPELAGQTELRDAACSEPQVPTGLMR